MTVSATDVLILGSHRHYLASVLKHSKSGPSVEIDLSDINPGHDDNAKCTTPEHAVIINSRVPFADNGTVVFYKQHGKFTVLLGRQTFQEAIAKEKFNGKISGLLLSSVTLKKARVE